MVASALLDELEDEGLCPQVGTEAFFPAEGKGGHVDPHHQRAIKVCAVCPVKDLCLSVALAYEVGTPARYRAGVWGGKTPFERADLDPKAGEADDEDDWAGEGFTVRNEESTT